MFGHPSNSPLFVLCSLRGSHCLPAQTAHPRHAAIVRVTHWITSSASSPCSSPAAKSSSPSALLLGRSRQRHDPSPLHHPHSLFARHGAHWLPLRHARPKWLDRALHFEAAWVVMIAGLAYALYGLFTGPFPPQPATRKRRPLLELLPPCLRQIFPPRATRRARSRGLTTCSSSTAYIAVILRPLPARLWTGLAMSPAFTAAAPGPSSFSEAAKPPAPALLSSPGCFCISLSSTSL